MARFTGKYNSAIAPYLSVYNGAIRSAAASAGAPYAEVRAGPVLGPDGNPVVGYVRSISCVQVSAIASSIGLVFPATPGTPTSPVNTTDANPTSPPAVTVGSNRVQLASAWSVLPTLEAVPLYLYRATTPPVAGNVLSFEFPEDAPFVITQDVPLLLWNFGSAGGSAFDVSFEVGS